MIVYDKYSFNTSREIDPVNGYLRVTMSNISKAQIRPYLGREIPEYERFNLDPNKIYNVLCPKEELEKAAKTFNNLPLTREHIEVDVDDVPKDKIVGSLGDHATVDGKYLKNNLIIYDKKDIDMVLSGKRKELSCGYRYTPVQESGEYEGQHYDFKMTDIIGNHVALVKQGRAGRDVMVADTSKGLLETIKEKIMAVFDSDIVEDAEEKKEDEVEWITVRGNHIPVGKGQSKEEAVKSFIESKKESEGKEKGDLFQKQLSSLKDSLKYQLSKEITSNPEKLRELAKNDDQLTKLAEVTNMGQGHLKNALNEMADELGGSEKKEESSKEKKYAKSMYEKAREDFIKSDEFERFKKTYSKTRGKYASYIDAKGGMFNDVDSALEDAVGGVDLEDDWAKNKINELAKEKVMYEWSKGNITSDKKLSESEQEKVGVVMKEFKEGELKSGSGEKVTDPKQAIAIALSEADKVAEDEIPEKQDEPKKAGEESALQQGEEEMAEEVKEEVKTEKKVETPAEEKPVEDACSKDAEIKEESKKEEEVVEDKEEKDLKGKEKEAFAEGVDYGEKKEKEEPKKLDSEHESKGAKKADKEEKEEKKEEKKEEMAKDSALVMDADALRAEGREQAMADFKCRDTARKAVKSIVGDVDIFAFDSAEEIYKFACKEAGMNLDEIASYKDAFAGLQAGKAGLAMDASPVSGSNDKECFKDIRLA